jgi:hypothetical protein
MGNELSASQKVNFEILEGFLSELLKQKISINKISESKTVNK